MPMLQMPAQQRAYQKTAFFAIRKATSGETNQPTNGTAAVPAKYKRTAASQRSGADQNTSQWQPATVKKYTHRRHDGYNCGGNASHES